MIEFPGIHLSGNFLIIKAYIQSYFAKILVVQLNIRRSE